MSENEGGESRTVGAFLLGFLTGVLVCVGIGGGFFLVVGQRSAMQARDAMMMAEEARRDAMEQRLRAERERKRAEENLKQAKDALEKAKKTP
jgi:hypothetical protein